MLGDLEFARKNLTEILLIAEPGPLSHEVSCELADVCLKLGQNSKTISICQQLLDLNPTVRIKQKALNILAGAYELQKDYNRAALALLGQWNGAKAPNEEKMSNHPIVTDQSDTEIQ